MRRFFDDQSPDHVGRIIAVACLGNKGQSGEMLLVQSNFFPEWELPDFIHYVHYTYIVRPVKSLPTPLPCSFRWLGKTLTAANPAAQAARGRG